MAQQNATSTLSGKKEVKTEVKKENVFVIENFKKSSNNLESQISSKKEINEISNIYESVIDKPKTKIISQSNLKKS